MGSNKLEVIDFPIGLDDVASKVRKNEAEKEKK